MRRLGVQADKRLVHQNQLRRMEPRGDNCQLLLHPVGISRNGLGQILRQLKTRSVVCNTRLPRRWADAENIRDKI